MSDFHKRIENNNLALFVLMRICVLISLRPNQNYIYSLCPIMYIKSTRSDVKSFLYYNIIKCFLFILNSLFQGDSLSLFRLALD
jgi:hypothetical protein